MRETARENQLGESDVAVGSNRHGLATLHKAQLPTFCGDSPGGSMQLSTGRIQRRTGTRVAVVFASIQP